MEIQAAPCRLGAAYMVASLDMVVDKPAVAGSIHRVSFCDTAGYQIYVVNRGGESVQIIADTYVRSIEMVGISDRNALLLDTKTYLFDGDTLVETDRVAQK